MFYMLQHSVFCRIKDKLYQFVQKFSYNKGEIMETAKTGTISGCIVWIIVFGIFSACLLPVAMIVGGVTSVSNFAMQTMGPIICPGGTISKSYSYATTTTDEYGNSQPSTAYELHCVDTNGIVVKEDTILYAFLWIGIIAIIGLVIAALLALVLAAPAGVLISRLLHRRQKSTISSTIEPN
jgi:ABC-type glycerol-3-phosphate transport system permease component